MDSDSDLVSMDSAESMFSNESDDHRERSIRERIMVKLLDDMDFRDKNCAYRLLDKDLERGVGRSKQDTTVNNSGS